MIIIQWIIVSIVGIFALFIIWFWIEDKIQSNKKPIRNGKVFPLKPWPDLKPGLRGGFLVLSTNTSKPNPFLSKKEAKDDTDKK